MAKVKHHSLTGRITLPLMHRAFANVQRNHGAAGIDRESIAAFEVNLEANLLALMRRLKDRSYRPLPLRRVRIPKGPGQTRPLGIPAVRDRVAQEVVRLLLSPLFERLFHDDSYGFRPGHNCHMAVRKVLELHRQGYKHVLDADIKGFFDALDHTQLRAFLQRRLRDGVLLRLIGKWLNAGVLEQGVITTPDKGTPQGGVISPLLANIYLHYVLDEWFEQVVKPRLKGQAFLVRYADDFVMGCACEEDARRVLEVLPQRFAKYGLSLHPDKTRLVPFRRPSQQPSSAESGPQSGTFDLLGFTHFWGRSRRGAWVVRRKTARSRFRRAVKTIARWCRVNRHLPVAQQHHTLSQQQRGHDAYYGITGNSRALRELRVVVLRLWGKWLARRRAGPFTWARFASVLAHFPLPPARVVHSVYRPAATPT